MVTSDRDSFQLASEHTTILQPDRGVSELARVGPAEVRPSATASTRRKFPISSLSVEIRRTRFRGAVGVGPKTAAILLAQYGTLEAMLKDGRFEAQAEELRLYRRMATLDASAPLPPLDSDQTPNWTGRPPS